MAETIVKMKDGVIRQQKNTILKNVNIEIQSGEFVYLIGKVGSGKSSFLKTLYAELPLEYGNAEVAGFQLKRIKKSQVPLLRRKCGIVFQDFKLLIDRDVYENLAFVLRATGWKNKKAIKERIETVLTKVEMLDKQHKMPHQLSGGEQQRIVLARALLNAPPLILADEPTGNIDPETSYRLVELLKEICETGKTIIIATHQYDLIEKYPGRVFCCDNGELFERIPQATACECVEEETNETVTINEEEAIVSEETEGETQQTTKEEVSLQEEATIEEVTIHKEEKITIEEEVTITAETVAPKETPAEEITLQQEAVAVKNATVAEEEPVGEEANDEDILSLIGKLDYPEITAFDYELEEITEGKPEVTTPPQPESSEENKSQTPPTQATTPRNIPPVMDLELID